MGTKITNCPCCNSKDAQVSQTSLHMTFVECPVCGRFQYDNWVFNNGSNKDEYASFFYYANKDHIGDTNDPHYLFVGKREDYEKESEKYPHCKYVSEDEVKAFYPRKFVEKINGFLCEIANRSSYIGEIIEFTVPQLISVSFVNRYNGNKDILENDEVFRQLNKILDYLKENSYLDYACINEICRIVLEPEGWKRVDEIQQQYPKNSKTAFVAMSFDPTMANVRDAIKKALTECNFIPRIMDEIEHNHQIVPEMLYEIREARFVIAELTGHNNGAYYEAGYALGCGKEVIHLCEKAKFSEDGHFDVKQINTVLWENTEDLTKKLVARIKSTIG